MRPPRAADRLAGDERRDVGEDGVGLQRPAARAELREHAARPGWCSQADSSRLRIAEYAARMSDARSQGQGELARTALQLVALGALVVATLWILKPFLIAATWAATLAIATWPLLLRAQTVAVGKPRARDGSPLLAFALDSGMIPLYLGIRAVVDERRPSSRSLSQGSRPGPCRSRPTGSKEYLWSARSSRVGLALASASSEELPRLGWRPTRARPRPGSSGSSAASDRSSCTSSLTVVLTATPLLGRRAGGAGRGAERFAGAARSARRAARRSGSPRRRPAQWPSAW